MIRPLTLLSRLKGELPGKCGRCRCGIYLKRCYYTARVAFNCLAAQFHDLLDDERLYRSGAVSCLNLIPSLRFAP